MCSTPILSNIMLTLAAISLGEAADLVPEYNSELALRLSRSRGDEAESGEAQVFASEARRLAQSSGLLARTSEQTLFPSATQEASTSSRLSTAPTEERRLLAATRVHFKNQTAEIDYDALERLAASTAAFSDGLVIAVQADSPRSPDAIAKLRAMAERVSTAGTANLEILPVQPWGKFVAPLNALVRHGVNHAYTDVLFLSQEVTVTPHAAQTLLDELDDNTLVVGARFPEHEFKPGQTLPLDGLTSPWNTLALWRLGKLAKLGFPLIAEGGIPGVGAGVEEVTAIAIAQRLDPDHTAAKLVDLPGGFTWDVGFRHDERRMAWHKRKMASKRSRPAAQIAALGLSASARVSHLPLSDPLDTPPRDQLRDNTE